MTRIKIQNDSEALDLLQKLVNDPSYETPEVEFENWPKFEMHVSGERYHSTITPELMESFLELQKTINKSFALVRYADSSRRLTNSDREELKILVEVGEGSSGFLAPLEDQASKISEAFVEGFKTMDSRHKLIAILSIGALAFSGYAFNGYMEDKKEVRLAEIQKIENDAERSERIRTLELYKDMNEGQTEKMTELYEKIIENMPQMLTITEHMATTYDKFIASTTDADHITVQGTKVPGEVVAEVSNTPRNTSVDDRIASVYRIQNVDHSINTDYKFKLFDVIRKTDVYATLPKDGSFVTDKILDLIQDAEWSRKVVLLQLRTKTRGGRVVKAEIEKVTEITDQDGYGDVAPDSE